MYRRKENRLEWHFHPACRKYPYRDFVQAGPEQHVDSTMVCHICKRLRDEDQTLTDTRPEKKAPGFLESLIERLLGR